MTMPRPRQHARRSPLAGLAALLCLLGATVAAREALLGWDGRRTEADHFVYDEGQFRSASSSVRLPRDVVQDWWIAPAAAESAAAAPAAAAVPAELLAWRAEAERLAARFPGCRGVQVLDEGHFRLTADRRHLYRYHFVGLILNEALLDWGTLNLGFTEGRTRVTGIRGRCLTPAGELLELSPDAVQVSRPGTRGDAFFDPNARQIHARLPGIEVGAVVEYEFQYDTFAPEDWRLFFPSFYFQGDIPVCRSVLEIAVPPDIPLLSWEENWDAAAETGGVRRLWGRLFAGRPGRDTHAELDGQPYRVRRWEKRDVPPVVPEPRMPPWNETAPAVHATIVTDWAQLNALVGALQRERMTLTPEIAAAVREITAGASAPEEQVAALYHWVQKNIRYISIKSSLSSGWAGHPAAETLRNGYGDCTDKSVLFATMLGALGIAAEPVVVQTNDAGLFIPRHPVVFGNHCITEVHLPDRRLFLDTTTQDHRYPALRADDHGVLALNFLRGTRTTVPVPPGLEARGKTGEEVFDLAPDGSLTARVLNRYTGLYEAGLRGVWKQVPEPLRPQIMQQYLNGIAPGARLGSFDLPDPQDLGTPFTLQFAYVLPDYAVRAGDYRILQIPDRERAFAEVSLEHRRYPLAYPTTEATHRELTVRLPPGWQLVALPPPLEIDSRHVRYAESCRLENGTLHMAVDYERRSQRIPAGDYAAYRRTLQRIEEATRRPFYFLAPPAIAAAPPHP